MKHKLKGVLGVALTLVMVLSLTVAFMPVATAADYKENDWATWGMPSLEPDTDIGPMAVAPDDTLFAAVLDFSGDTPNDDWVWKVQKSDDDGYTWVDTELELDAWDTSLGSWPYWVEDNAIVDIAIGKNYDDDEIFYVATFGGIVYRVEDAGDDDVIALKDYPDEDVSELYSIDTWYDGDDNWIMVGTDEDVFVLRDAVFEDWGDQELKNNAYEVAFAPDFDDSELIWAITDDDAGDPVGNYVITSTVSPGMWGLEIGEVTLQFDGSDVAAYPWVDLGFPDNYDSDPDSGDTILFAAISSNSSDGGVYLIEGVEDNGDSNAVELFDLAGEAFVGTSIVSIAVSGDYPDCVILAAALEEPSVFISTDGGDDWSGADKNPTGWYDWDASFWDVPNDYFSWTHVYMEADVVWGGDVFDVEESMSFVSTVGDESAVSRSDPNEDGDLLYNQVGNIDTYIDDIDDIAFHPDFPNTPTFLMTTDNRTTTTTDSVWLTENGDEEEPDYMRVLCGHSESDGNNGYISAPGNHLAKRISLVEFSQDGDAIYLFGFETEWSEPSIWKSTDDGQTFGKRRTVQSGTVTARIEDWVITDSKTIYAAVDNYPDGFYMTTNSGLSWSDAATATGDAMRTIVLSPDFEDDETILMGSDDGEVYMSDDGGDSFDNTGVPFGNGGGGNTFVAFDADYADEDADGYMFIYAAAQDEIIQQGEVSDTDDVDWDPLEDDTNDGFVTIYCEGLVVSEDNVLYAVLDIGGAYEDEDGAIDDEDDGAIVFEDLVRLILHEDDSLWEDASDDDLDWMDELWLTPGTNVLWTIDDDTDGDNEPEIWVLEDTCSGQVTLDSPKDGYQSDREDTIQIAWDEVRDADEYEYSLTDVSGLDPDAGEDNTDIVDDTSETVEVIGSEEYEWTVRVAPGEPWHSRWSDEWTFHTALGKPPWAPTLYTPGGVWQYSGLAVDLMPAFSWESAKTADGYQFVLADNAEFTSPLVNEKTPESAYNLDFELEYNSNYFWRVMAYKGTTAISRWSDIGAFTTTEKAVPALTPAPPVTVTPAAPAPIVLPTPIPPILLWVIVGIGAALIIAVIILIVRTRRVV